MSHWKQEENSGQEATAYGRKLGASHEAS